MWLRTDYRFAEREFSKFFITKDNYVRTDEFAAIPILLPSKSLKSCKKKESKKQPFRKCLPVKLTDGRMSIKKEKKLIPDSQHCQFG